MCGRSTIKQFYFALILVLLQLCGLDRLTKMSRPHQHTGNRRVKVSKVMARDPYEFGDQSDA